MPKLPCRSVVLKLICGPVKMSLGRRVAASSEEGAWGRDQGDLLVLMLGLSASLSYIIYKHYRALALLEQLMDGQVK